MSTPQDIALLDARRGAEMFRKVRYRAIFYTENNSIIITIFLEVFAYSVITLHMVEIFD